MADQVILNSEDRSLKSPEDAWKRKESLETLAQSGKALTSKPTNKLSIKLDQFNSEVTETEPNMTSTRQFSKTGAQPSEKHI
tara:strand:- start:314 stop:559 length:246 start_codon:yes stop_codon:yes gene_type:complete